MANLRTGTFGSYYGSYFNESEPLTTSEMEVNAKYIYSYFSNKGWSINSIAAILGNMTTESSLNPGRWQSDNVGNTSGGYSLVQWTPSTNYTNWVEGDPSEMDNALSRIIYELENNLQWISTDSYPLSFTEFTKSNSAIDYLTTAFLKNYERAGVENLSSRIEYANQWYSVISGEEPSTPGGSGSGSSTTKKKKGFNFILFNRRRKIFK